MPSIGNVGGGIYGGKKELGSNSEPLSSIYTVDTANWYSSLPYGFSFTNRQNDSEKIYLPILPSNISVSTQFATNVVTTLYGVVEEHSEIRYYDISINGTTGIAPRWILSNKDGESGNPKQTPGRESDDFQTDLLGGFLPEVTNTINQVKDIASDIAGAFGADPFSTGGHKTGVNTQGTGYLAFHNLYRFLLRYKKDAAGVGNNGAKQRDTHPLQFLNFKDNIKYDVVIQSFTLNRSADNPMLYNYNIKMRGYNLQNVNSRELEKENLEKLGLGDFKQQSLFTQLTSVAGNAATLLSAGI